MKKLSVLLAAFVLTNVAIAQNLQVTLTPSNYNGFNISCFGSRDGSITVTVTGGTPPYSYEWSNDEITQTINQLAGGYYGVRVKDNASNEAFAEITLEEPEPLRVIELMPYTYSNGFNTSSYNSCNGTVTYTLDGGASPYNYFWRPGNQTVAIPTNLCANEHHLLVTDANGCKAEGSVNIRQPERSDWTMTGNFNSNPTTQFIGTNDNIDFSIRTYNQERLRVLANGDLKINGLAGTGIRILTTDANGKIGVGVTIIAPVTTCPDPFVFAWQFKTGTPNVAYTCWNQVGIGTDDPQGNLGVKGRARFFNFNNHSAFVDVGHDGLHGSINSTDDLLVNYYSGKKLQVNTGATRGDFEAGGNTYLATGAGKNVGIGKLTAAYKLDVDGEVNATGLRINNIPINLSSQWLAATNPDDIYYDAGNVGIGESNPDFKLVVNGDKIVLRENNKELSFDASNSDPEIGSSSGIITFWKTGVNYNTIISGPHVINGDPNANESTSFTYGAGFFRTVTNGSSVIFLDSDNNESNEAFVIASNNGSFSNNEILRIDQNAMVYYNQNSPNNTVNFKVTSAGAAYSRSMRVTYNAFPDYVFNKNYELMPLNELSDFIRKNKHLPGIPSAEEVQKEGLDLGEISAKLLEKVEELTLHMIEMNKKTEQLAEENEVLRKEIFRLKK